MEAIFRVIGERDRSVESVLLIRDAQLIDAAAISQLVSDSVRDHIAPTQSATGTMYLLSEMNTASVESYLQGGFRFFIAEVSGTIVGLSAVRLPSHLYYLFIRSELHGRGIGRQLWDHTCDWILQHCDSDHITVNASLNAVSIYKSLGFEVDGQVAEKNEVQFQPMIWTKSDRIVG